MTAFDPYSALAQVLDQDGERIVRLWSKRLRTELSELQLKAQQLRAPLPWVVSELARLLHVRGEEALWLWPETIRSYGAIRYDQRLDADDLAREFKVLHQVILRVYARHYGRVEPQVAEILAELLGEAVASVESSFARVLRTEEVRFKEAAVMETLLHHIEVGIVLADPDGTISYVTPPAGKLLGFPVRSLLGIRPRDTLPALLIQLDARHPDGRPFHGEELPYVRVLDEKAPVTGVLMEIAQPPTGRRVLLELSATPLWVEGEDELSGVIETLTDSTEKTQSARDLYAAHDEVRKLEGQLLERSRALAVGQLASGIAHALNNQLNAIRLRLSLLQKEFRPENLEALDQSVDNVGALVGRLQDFAAPAGPEIKVATDPNRAIREAVQLLSPEFGGEGPQVHVVQALWGSGQVEVDEIGFREVVANLFLLARDRTPKGGSLTVHSETRDGTFILRVEDSGPPFSEKELSSLFDPLVPSSQKPHQALLLAVAQSQVQGWGGELRCENRPGNIGAASEVRLPLAEAPKVKVAEKPAPPPSAPPPSRRVLVVDDDLDNAQMLAEVLSDEGYEVKVAHTGEAAIALWESQPFGAALLDLRMPDVSGWELARDFRAHSPAALLGLVTGADVRGQSRENLGLVDGIFHKPLDLAALDEFLSQALRPVPEHLPPPHH